MICRCSFLCRHKEAILQRSQLTPLGRSMDGYIHRNDSAGGLVSESEALRTLNWARTPANLDRLRRAVAPAGRTGGQTIYEAWRIRGLAESQTRDAAALQTRDS